MYLYWFINFPLSSYKLRCLFEICRLKANWEELKEEASLKWDMCEESYILEVEVEPSVSSSNDSRRTIISINCSRSSLFKIYNYKNLFIGRRFKKAN